VKIASYNILAMRGYPPSEAVKDLGEPLGDRHAEHFTKVFAELDCDLIALQEGVNPAFLHPIAYELGCNAATFVSPCKWPGHLLSRHRIVESRTFSHFSPQAESAPLSRCAGAALVEFAHGRQIWVVVVHLYPFREEWARRVQESQLLAGHVDGLLAEHHDMIVLGDFNSGTEEEFHQVLRQRNFINAMEAAGGGLAYTIPSFGEGNAILDHIYVSPSLSSGLKKAAVVKAEGFHYPGEKEPGIWVHSDHLPVWAEIELDT